MNASNDRYFDSTYANVHTASAVDRSKDPYAKLQFKSGPQRLDVITAQPVAQQGNWEGYQPEKRFTHLSRDRAVENNTLVSESMKQTLGSSRGHRMFGASSSTVRAPGASWLTETLKSKDTHVGVHTGYLLDAKQKGSS
jgi:hypothetical protein